MAQSRVKILSVGRCPHGMSGLVKTFGFKTYVKSPKMDQLAKQFGITHFSSKQFFYYERHAQHALILPPGSRFEININGELRLLQKGKCILCQDEFVLKSINTHFSTKHKSSIPETIDFKEVRKTLKYTRDCALTWNSPLSNEQAKLLGLEFMQKLFLLFLETAPFVEDRDLLQCLIFPPLQSQTEI